MKYNTDKNSEVTSSIIKSVKRRIPFNIVLRIWSANPLNVMGIILSLFLLPFTLIMVPFSDFFSMPFSTNDPVTSGIITGSAETNAQIGSEVVYMYEYQWQLPDGRILSREGYSTGNTRNTGDEIKIYYKMNNPEKFRAVELRNSLFEGQLGAVFILVFQSAGLLLLFSGTRKVIHRYYLLRIGVISNSKMVDKKPNDENEKRNTIYTLTFEFTASNFITYRKIITPSLFQLPRLSGEGVKLILYDPDSPEDSLLLEQLPKGIKDLFMQLV